MEVEGRRTRGMRRKGTCPKQREQRHRLGKRLRTKSNLVAAGRLGRESARPWGISLAGDSPRGVLGGQAVHWLREPQTDI